MKLYVHLLRMKKKDKGGYRKDGKPRRRLTLSVTQESIDEAHKVDESLSRAFEKVFTVEETPKTP